MKTKRLFLALLLLVLPLAPVGWTGMTCKNNNQTAYQTIGTAEQAVISANGAFLDTVVTGQTPTNNVPKVEAAFNDVQLALHTAAVAASAGTNAPVSALLSQKVSAFIATANAKGN